MDSEGRFAIAAFPAQIAAMTYRVLDDQGEALDARLDIEDGEIVFYSRSGKRSDRDARNLDYGPALRLLLHRIFDAGQRVTNAWIDSDDVVHLERADREIMDESARSLPPHALFSHLSKTMQAYGRPEGAAYGGSRVKRIRLATSWSGSTRDLAELLLIEKVEDASNRSPAAEADPSWSEGRPRLVTHFVRERAPGLAQAKRAAFVRIHGRLFCERCGLDPIAAFGELGAACIEIHHDRQSVASMAADARTVLADLRCICANCHRIVHAEMRQQFLADSLDAGAGETALPGRSNREPAG